MESDTFSEGGTPVQFTGRWIGIPGAVLFNSTRPVLPAPLFRKSFTMDGAPRSARIRICGLGYYELYLNGEKVGDHVLDPGVTQYDRRVLFVEYDVCGFLRPGLNVVGVILGNGWYNCFTPASWNFDKASWRDYPKFLLDLEVNEAVQVSSDVTWKYSSGPIRFDGLRNGEHYDAARECEGWSAPGYDDSDWVTSVETAPPGGKLVPQLMPPCKVMETLEPVRSWRTAEEDFMYDLGANISGWARIMVSGEAGEEVVIRYGEQLDSEGRLDTGEIDKFILDGGFQTDRYRLKGGGGEIWEPRFSYHGFQYIQISTRAELFRVEGRVVHTAFAQIGKFIASDPAINRLQKITVRSYLSNFTSIPTDCPHREKNGWTGDAHLAAETGLMQFSAAEAYSQWIDSIADSQRPSGQLPGIVPTTGWGFNWGNGPAWDSAFLLIPWYIYLYTGNPEPIHRHYQAMKRYVNYCLRRSKDGIADFGLGDWCSPDPERMVDRAVTDTGYAYRLSVLLSRFALITGRSRDSKEYADWAVSIRESFNKTFYKGSGLYAQGEQTALACALYQGLVEETEKESVVMRLSRSVENAHCKADFGVLGAKYVPRVLAEYGRIDLAYRLLTQTDFPGWGHWLKRGATSLWENWDGSGSRNHIMFGDVSAWMYHFLAGIRPDPEQPGFRHMLISPKIPPTLEWVEAEHAAPHGTIRVRWEKAKDAIQLDVEIPMGSTATIQTPDGIMRTVGRGAHRFHSAC
ncbi:MAG: family 78 glycoside hydrolase catalytic domain [Verrucomicrobia bacterium]|nr:family 78 glycoside hydrolase catalytic domain [Verrucomicrobiota bacterium]